jgi:hypothetical protein
MGDRPALAPRAVRLLDLERPGGEAGDGPGTRVGGAPWWPVGRPRPACDLGHALAFVAQVRLTDVPGLGAPDDRLLSFHYCDACMREGDASFGWGHDEPGGRRGRYAVDVLAAAPGDPADGLGAAAGAEPHQAARVGFFDTEEWPGPEDDPETWDALGEDVTEANVVLPYSELTDAHPDLPVHFERSKLGGWPSWAQHPEWPRCAHRRRMRFVGQLGDWDFRDAAWSGGGHAHLFVCGPECADPHGELVIQTT